MKTLTPRWPATDKDRARWTRFTFVLHLRPVRVPARTLRWTHTFGLGGSSLVLIAALMASGLLMMLAYVPSPEAAYDSVVRMQEEVLFGRLVRAVHHWSANLVIVVACLHLLRVFLTGGFHGPRQFNWVLGLGLLATLLAANFTGYLLPWDQRAYWATTVGTEIAGVTPVIGDGILRIMRGGEDLSAVTLARFFGTHVWVLPVLLISLIAFHLYLVIRIGISAVPRRKEERDNG